MFKKGFTMVEILIVLVIIGILLSFFVVNGVKSIDTANTKQCASNIHALETALMMYYTEYRKYPATTSVDDLVPYLPKEMTSGTSVKTCPFNNTAYTLTTDLKEIDRGGHFTDFPNKHK